MSAQLRGLVLKGRQTCRFLVLFSAHTAAWTSRLTPLARRTAIIVLAACGPGTLIATSLVTGRLSAQEAWSPLPSPSAANAGGCSYIAAPAAGGCG